MPDVEVGGPIADELQSTGALRRPRDQSTLKCWKLPCANTFAGGGSVAITPFAAAHMSGRRADAGTVSGSSPEPPVQHRLAA